MLLNSIFRDHTMARAASNRLDASFSDQATIQKIARLTSVLETGKADLFRGALDVFDWCIRQVQEGRQIASIDDSGAPIRELATPLLEAAREQRRLRLSAEAFDAIAQIVANPPAPTPELRALMAESTAPHDPERTPPPEPHSMASA